MKKTLTFLVLYITLIFNLAFSFFNQEKLSEKKFFSNQTLVQESIDDCFDDDSDEEFKYLSHNSSNNKVKLQKISKITKENKFLSNFTSNTPTPPPNSLI